MKCLACGNRVANITLLDQTFLGTVDIFRNSRFQSTKFSLAFSPNINGKNGNELRTQRSQILHNLIFEPVHDKTKKMACAPSEDSDQPGHSPSPIRVFAIRMKKAWVFS